MRPNQSDWPADGTPVALESSVSVSTALPAQAAVSANSKASPPVEEALVPSPVVNPPQLLPLNPILARLPVELEVSVPVRGFRVRNLLALVQGRLVETQWDAGEDLPLTGGGVQLAWSEFEVVDSQMAVRITRLG